MPGKADFLSQLLGLSDRDEAIRSHRVPKRRSTAPLITVFRLEFRDDPKKGAFWSQGLFDNSDALIWPAIEWAENNGQPAPDHLPNIMKDGDEMAHGWTYHHYAGWSGFDQIDMWLPLPEMRAVVYDVPQSCVREYRVPRDRVLFGEHQIGFVLDQATPVRHLPREEFVRPDVHEMQPRYGNSPAF